MFDDVHLHLFIESLNILANERNFHDKEFK